MKIAILFLALISLSLAQVPVDSNSSIGKRDIETVLDIASGGTNSGTALTNGKMVWTTGGAIVENAHVTVSHPSTMEMYTSADNYPLMQILPFSHDNVAICFDCRWHINRWVSSHSGSNFMIYKLNNALQFQYASGKAQGDTTVFNPAISIASNGAVTINAETGGSKITLPNDGLGGSLDFYAVKIYNVPVDGLNQNVVIKAVRVGRMVTLTFEAVTGTVVAASSFRINAGELINSHFWPVGESIFTHYHSWPIFVNNGGAVLGRIRYTSSVSCLRYICEYYQYFDIYASASFGTFSVGSDRGWTDDFSISYYV